MMIMIITDENDDDDDKYVTLHGKTGNKVIACARHGSSMFAHCNLTRLACGYAHKNN
jgi:hypothetical protein